MEMPRSYIVLFQCLIYKFCEMLVVLCSVVEQALSGDIV